MNANSRGIIFNAGHVLGRQDVREIVAKHLSEGLLDIGRNAHVGD